MEFPKSEMEFPKSEMEFPKSGIYCHKFRIMKISDELFQTDGVAPVLKH